MCAYHVILVCREGNYRFLPAEMPFTPGIEGSGQICSVGAKVTGLAKGDRCVFFGHHGQQSGSHATFCTADASVCFRIPDAIDLQTAAAATVAYCTAYRALRQQVSPIKPGQSLLVHGASGGKFSAKERHATLRTDTMHAVLAFLQI